uniref:Myb/SANT-like domain-containing protein n=1 Tax=Lactuca sativa TaxID=4236 RepID=A0A9R1WD97_LACSA|nr:hypothetical protein LSAT_V11C200089370 [Lactuca sativa]
MSEQAFKKLCVILRCVCGLQPTQRMSLKIMLQDFYTLNTFVSWMYRRSKSTTSKCFHRVFCSVIALESLYIQQPQGAIDGTHVHIKVPNRDAPIYRGHKGYPMINVLVACSFDLKFTYVLTGRYYLVDAGLSHSTTAPYRGVRYHLKEYSTRAPQNARESFKLHHASLCNAIEKGIWCSKYKCCILHNFLIGEECDKDLEDEVLQEVLSAPTEEARHNSSGACEGYRLHGNFTTQAYANMVEELNKKLNMNLTKSNLKNRLKSLKYGFSQWYDMFHKITLNGFGWNAKTRLIEADDQVWDHLIKSKPEAAILKTKKVANFEQMLVLFARDRASGENVEITKERNVRFNKTIDIKIESISEVDDLLVSNDVTVENQRIDDDDEDDIQVVSPTPEQNPSAKKCKNEVEKEVEPQPQPETKTSETKIMNVVGDVANAMREAYQHELTGDETYQELQRMGLEPHEIPSALMYLAHNQANVRMFTCPMNIQKDLLKTMMDAGK